jgi:hypothetical protein
MIVVFSGINAAASLKRVVGVDRDDVVVEIFRGINAAASLKRDRARAGRGCRQDPGRVFRGIDARPH